MAMRKRAGSGTGEAVGFGVAQANAYFNARRLGRRAPTKAKNKVGAKAREAEADQEDEEEDEKLMLPPPSALRAILRSVDERDSKRQRIKHQSPSIQFPMWRSQLKANHNLLFYGFGSKRALLHEFASQCLANSLVIQIHGYLPTVSLRYLVDLIHKEAFPNQRVAAGTLVQQCQEIAKTRQTSSQGAPLPRIYLIVHSIDGVAMRTPEIQTCLSWLSTASFITMIASIDQVNGLSVWKEEDSLRFQWIHQQIDTWAPYTDEVELRVSKESKSTDQSSSGVKFILQSLTPTDVSTLQVIARHQLAAPFAGRSKTGQRADYERVYDECRKKLLHTTIRSMKNSIKCLQEHGLVKTVRVRNVEKLEIPLQSQLIQTEILQITDDTKATQR